MPTYRTLWDDAVALNEAWLKLASEADQTKYHSTLGPTALRVASTIALALNFEVAKAQLAAGANFNARAELEQELKSKLLSGLISGQFIAIEFANDISARPKPIRLEAYPTAQIDWGNAEICWRQFRYQNVRVLSRETVPVDLIQILLRDLKPKPAGRPSSAGEINSALSEIAKDDDFLNAPIKLIAARIRERIGVKPDAKGGFPQGYSDKTLERCIARFRNQFGDR